MDKNKYTDEEIKKLDNFLQYKFYYDIYSELTDEDNEHFKLFEPLKFLPLVKSQITFIEKNKHRPIFVSQTLKKMSFTNDQFYYFYNCIINYFHNERRSDDEQIHICYREIIKLRNSNRIEDEESFNLKGDFDFILEHLETLYTYKEKINYLRSKKTKYEQNNYLQKDSTKSNLIAKCELEIKKWEETEKLQLKQSNSKMEHDDSNKKQKKGLTRELTNLFMYYLFEAAKVECSNTKKGEVLSDLTGFSENTLSDGFSDLHAKANKNFVEYEKDMVKIRGYFETLDLKEIVKMINEDLKEGNTK